MSKHSRLPELAVDWISVLNYYDITKSTNERRPTSYGRKTWDVVIYEQWESTSKLLLLDGNIQRKLLMLTRLISATKFIGSMYRHHNY